MRIFLSILVTVLLFNPLYSQKTKSKNFKRSYLDKPTIPADLSKFWVTLYTGPTGITKDTLRKYMGNMEILKSDTERLGGGTGYFSVNQTALAKDGWNFHVEIAYGNPIEHSKETAVVEESYFYKVTYELPTAISIKDEYGKTLDAWFVNGVNHLQFGNESLETIESTGSGTRVTLGSLNFKSEEALANGWARMGRDHMNRKSVLVQMRKSIEAIYPRIYFSNTGDKFKIATGSGKKFDYSELEAAQEKGIDALESGDDAALKEVISVWESYADQVDITDNKAMINRNVAADLHKNLALSYMYLNDFDKALDNATAFKGFEAAPTGSNVTMTTSSGQPEIDIYELIYFRKKGFVANGSQTLGETFKGIDLKKELGKRNKNKDIDFISFENRYAEVSGAAEKVNQSEMARISEVQNEAADIRTGGNKYRDRIVNSSTQGNVLSLNALIDGSIANGPMPGEITDLVELNELIVSGMKFTEIPDEIGNLKDLKKLNLSGNSLSSLPESVGQLTNLKTLNVNNNQLTSLPASLTNCKNLKNLRIKGNNIAQADIDAIAKALPDCKIK